MGKKGKASRKPKQRAEQEATRPGQNAFGEAAERAAYQGQAARSDAFGETAQRSAQPGRAPQPNRSQQQNGKRPAQQQGEV